MFKNCSARNQIITTIILGFAYASIGCNLAWTSPSLVKLLDTDSKIPITEEQGSWIGSILAIGATVSPLLSCKLLDLFGRKRILHINAILLLAGWVLIWLSNSVELLCIGRFITGFACGIFFLGLPMFIAEITEDSLRGPLSSTIELAVCVGCNLEYFAGPYLSYNNLIIASMMPTVIFLIFFSWIPESPYYLISKGDTNNSIKSLQWFRGNISKEMAEKESVIILSTMYEQMQNKSGIKDLISVPGNRKGLWLNLILVTLTQLTGITVIQLYLELIFIKSGSSIPAKYSAMFIGTVQFLSSASAPSVIKKLGYRNPLLIGGVITAVQQFVLGMYFYLDHKNVDLSLFGWVPVTCLVVFMLTFPCSYGPVPWAILGESFPSNIKALASAIGTSVCLFDIFILTKFFTNVSELLGIYWGFWIFSISMIISVIFVYFYLPDTKGLSLQEIQEILNKQKSVANSKA